MSLQLLEVLICHSEDLHTVVDPQARLVFVNQAAQRIFGYPPEECIGRSAFDFVHADDRQRTRQAFEDWIASAGDEPLHLENRQVSRTGAVNHMAWTVYPQYDDDGRAIGFASSARDVTAERLGAKRLLRRSTLAQALLEGMLDPVVALDEHGIVRVASRSVGDVLGHDPDGLVGRHIERLLPERSRAACHRALADYRSRGRSKLLGRTLSLQLQHLDGHPVDVELSIADVEVPGSHRLFVGSFRDVSRRRQAERAERSMVHALARIGESAALLAHEIKHPVTAVNLALRAVADQLGEDQREVIEDLAARMRRLELQLRQTLSFARPLDLDLTPCAPERLLARVAHAMEPVVDNSRVSLEWRVADGTPAPRADAGRLEEVFANLLINAVEMLTGGGRVCVTAAQDGPQHVVFDIEDDGPGVPTSIQDDLFQPFVTSKPEGTGLGLPICRRIVEAHGGTIELADARAAATLGGARFRMRLPVRPPIDEDRSP